MRHAHKLAMIVGGMAALFLTTVACSHASSPAAHLGRETACAQADEVSLYVGTALEVVHAVADDLWPNWSPGEVPIVYIHEDGTKWAVLGQPRVKQDRVACKSRGYHAHVGESLYNIAAVLAGKGEKEKALEQFSKALGVWEKALGPHHPLLSWALGDIGVLLAELGRHRQAIETLQRSVSLCERKRCHEAPHGQALFALAQALVATGGDSERAYKLAQQAEQVCRRSPQHFKRQLEEISAWLKEHRKK